jgi:hypothetical protein
MLKLTGITDAPKQSSTFALDDGTKASIIMEYRPQQLGWFCDIATDNFEVKGLRMVTFPNILRQFQNQIAFGLAIVTQDTEDPIRQSDFASNYASLVLLNADDVAAVEAAQFTRND